MHARDWIRVHGRFIRSIGASQLRKRCQRRPGECTWCGGRVAGRRSTWCSNQCVDAFLATQPRNIRHVVHARDHGKCAMCGRDCDRMYYLSARIAELQRLSQDPDAWAEALHALNSHWYSLGFNKPGRRGAPGSFWEADHIQPVSLGGGMAGISGYRTVCVPCHKCRHAVRNAPRKRKSKKGRK